MKAILLANGDAPKKSLIKKLKAIGYEKLICADGGANTAYKLKLMPDIIIGDLDSISEKVYSYFEKKVIIKKIKRQNDTDVEKALKYLISKKFSKVILLGATGNRLDHTFCNLGIVLKYFEKIDVDIIHENSILTAFKGTMEFDAEIGETISVYGFDNKTKFVSEGLKYKLNNISLKFGERESTSNKAVKSVVKIQSKNGIAFLIRDVKISFKHAFV